MHDKVCEYIFSKCPMIDRITTSGGLAMDIIRLELGNKHLQFSMDYYSEEFLDRVIHKFNIEVCPYYDTPLWRKLEGQIDEE